jgi:hypothetical protein
MNIRRHTSSTGRIARVATAAAVVTLFVLGSGAAQADDGGAGSLSGAAASPATIPSAPPSSTGSSVGADTQAPAAPPSMPSAPKSTPKPTSKPSVTPAKTPAKTPAITPALKNAAAGAIVAAPVTKKASVSLTSALAPLVVPCVGGPGTVVGGFEIDGNLCTNVPGNLDWDTVGMTTDDGFGDHTTFTGGTSEGDNPAGWSLGTTSPNGKTDIGQVWAYSQSVAGTVYGYFALTNDSTSGGTSQYDVEYNQAGPNGNGMPVRTPGDLLFRFSSTGSQPIVFTDAKKWTLQSSPSWSGASCFAVTGTNAGWCTVPIPMGVFAQATSTDGTFFEGAINISLLFGAGNCTGNFGSVDIRSVTGNSFYSSALKDYVTPLSVNTPSTCGTLIINKADGGGAPLAGATFSVSPNPDPTKNPATPYSITDNGAGDSDPAPGVIKISPVTPGVAYTVTETAAPPGYLLDNPSGTSTNPQTVAASGTATFNFVDHKIWSPLTISKTASPSYHASYAWSILKEIGGSSTGPWHDSTDAADPFVKNVADGTAGAGDLWYRTVVTEGAETTANYLVTGTIHVGNPNSDAVTATVSDSLPGGTCTIAGNASPYTVAVPAGGADYAYSCDLGSAPALADITGAKTNTAHVAWAKATYPQTVADLTDPGNFTLDGTAGYQFGAPTTATNQTVTLSDNQSSALNGISYTWSAQGTQHVLSPAYSTSHVVSPGTCTSVISNTASVIGDGATTLDSSSAYGKICDGADLTITRMDAETLTRTYPWSVQKSTSTPKIYVVNGHAVADYEVTVTAGAGVDSAWNITGTITVHNPNNWEAVDVTSLPVSYSGGGTCAVTGETFPVSVAAGGTHDFAYSCNFTSQPSYSGNIDAQANWDAAAASTPTGSVDDSVAVVDSDWVKTPVNATVNLVDDNGTPGDTSDDTTTPLDWATVYAMPNHQDVIDYTTDISGSGIPDIGTCGDRKNTVKILGDGNAVLDADNNVDNNSAIVQICNPYTQIAVLKVDYETGAPLAGATFSLSQGGTQIGTATSAADGTATFSNKLLPGDYVVTETGAPDGYSLPVGNEGTVSVHIDNITDPGTNFVENGVMPAITFRDPAQGQIAIISKLHEVHDPTTGTGWVPSTGAVQYDQEIRYVVNIGATGPKLFHNVTVSDYVPGYNPADTTTTSKAVLETNTPTCSGDYTCGSPVFDATTGKITWTLTSAGQATGDVVGDTTGAVDFVVTVPEPANPVFTNGLHIDKWWNQAYLDWTQNDPAPASDRNIVRLARPNVLVSSSHELTSNEVVDAASITAPPVVHTCAEKNPPASLHCSHGKAPLPDTGGPQSWIYLLGLALTLIGTGLVAAERRLQRRS